VRRRLTGVRREDLLAQDVGMPCVLGEFAQDLQVQRPHSAFAATVNNVFQGQFGRGAARGLASVPSNPSSVVFEGTSCSRACSSLIPSRLS
jgi:hypothetical protein